MRSVVRPVGCQSAKQYQRWIGNSRLQIPTINSPVTTHAIATDCPVQVSRDDGCIVVSRPKQLEHSETGCRVPIVYIPKRPQVDKSLVGKSIQIARHPPQHEREFASRQACSQGKKIVHSSTKRRGFRTTFTMRFFGIVGGAHQFSIQRQHQRLVGTAHPTDAPTAVDNPARAADSLPRRRRLRPSRRPR
jgi:hypothetical protein